MELGLVVGSGFRGLDSVRKYVLRLKERKGQVNIHLLHPHTAGEHLASMTAVRAGRIVIQHYLDPKMGNAAAQMRRVNLVQAVDAVVVFDDGSSDVEHVVNLSNKQGKLLAHFREV